MYRNPTQVQQTWCHKCLANDFASVTKCFRPIFMKGITWTKTPKSVLSNHRRCDHEDRDGKKKRPANTTPKQGQRSFSEEMGTTCHQQNVGASFTTTKMDDYQYFDSRDAIDPPTILFGNNRKRFGCHG